MAANDKREPLEFLVAKEVRLLPGQVHRIVQAYFENELDMTVDKVEDHGGMTVIWLSPEPHETLL